MHQFNEEMRTITIKVADRPQKFSGKSGSGGRRYGHNIQELAPFSEHILEHFAGHRLALTTVDSATSLHP